MSAKMIMVANQKGGVGKSSTTLLLGSEMPIMTKSKVLIIDTDPQRSVGKILDHENDMKPFACSWLDLTSYGDDAHGIIEEVAQHVDDYDYIIMDLRGKLDGQGVNEKLMELADLIITPVKPDQSSIDGTVDTLAFYNEVVRPNLESRGIQPPEMRLWWLLPKPSEILSIEKMLIEQFNKDTEEMGVMRFETPLHHWNEIRVSMAGSTPISVISSGGKGVKEIRSVCKEIEKILK
jgi:cellulose biosynthesis protein BcsQ